VANNQNEVRPYLIRLITTIACGVVVMVTAATWAWNRYGARLETAPPLPAGKPEIIR
jgi:hypothetical protein